jgi:large subunit ribosomal protein L22
MEKQQTATLRYLHIAPRKVRLIANTLKGLSLQEAEAQLLHRPQRGAKPLLKLLRSAAANAEQKQLVKGKLVITEIRVDQGPMLKRALPRAMGRATPIQKIMSHVFITLSEREGQNNRFTINPPVKREKKKEEKPKATKTPPKQPIINDQASDKKERRGFLKKIFRRKSI